MNRVAAYSARAHAMVVSIARGGEIFVFRFAPDKGGREALYDALDDHLRDGILADEDVRAVLLNLERQVIANQERPK